jgi:hypothetical protein
MAPPRVSLYPTQGSSNQAAVTKQRHLTHLQAKLQELSGNAVNLQQVMQTTAEQAACIRELGGYHAAL